jgi:hypothetical protein
MAEPSRDNVSQQAAFNLATVIPTVRIAPEIPVIFADGVLSHAFGPDVSKFYFYRTDSAPDGSNSPNVNVPIAQIVMPADGFVRMVLFLQHRIKMMVEAGALKQSLVDEIAKSDPRTAT